MNKLDTKVFKCFRFPRTCSQTGESPQPRKTTRKMKHTHKKKSSKNEGNNLSASRFKPTIQNQSVMESN